MKRKRIFTILVLVLLTCALSTTAFAIDESEVESAIAASSQEEVAGNIFIWFLCAIGFLKVSQKIDSFMASLGVNVGRTGGSMLAELMVAGRGIATAAGAFGSTVSNRHSSHGTHNGGQAAGAAFTGGGNGLVGVTKRAVGNAAASSATGTGSGLSNIIGGAMFGSSLASGGKFATSVIGAVAKGDISSVGSITGEQASEALTSYLGYSSAAASEMQTDDPVTIPTAPTPMNGEDVVTLDGGTAAGVIPPETQPWAAPSAPNPVVSSPVGAKPVSEGGALTGVITTATHTASTTPTAPSPGTVREGAGVPSSPPTFRNVEIGGGRITGHEVAPDGQSEREFAMYSTEQYMAPTGPYDTVQTVDGASWYRQYAQPKVEKTPYMEVLYTIFNRATCEVKPVEKRVRELQAARKDTDISVPVPLKSVLAPESIDLTHGSYVVMDGVYHAYLIVPSDGYNPRVVAGWTSILVNAGEGIDVDFFFSREPKERIQAKLGQQIRINRSRLKDTSDTNTDFDDFESAIRSGYFLKEGLANYEDFYYCNTLVTVTADTLENLEWRISEVRRLMISQDMDIRICRFRQEQALLSILPFCKLDKKLFEASKRNMLTSSAASCYPFTSFEMSDENGILLGVNQHNNSLVIVDIFNSRVYKNANTHFSSGMMPLNT